MISSRVQFHIWIVTASLIMAVPRLAKGDGGVIRLRETQGPFSVTVFASPEAAAGGLADLSVLVQGSESGKVVLDADVTFTLSPPVGEMKQADVFCSVPTAAMPLPDGISNLASVRASREQASNKLLYAAPVQLNTPGDWKLHVVVSRGTDTARFNCLLPVTLASGKLTGLWPYLLFPPLAIAAFSVNQWLRGRRCP